MIICSMSESVLGMVWGVLEIDCEGVGLLLSPDYVADVVKWFGGYRQVVGVASSRQTSLTG